MARKKKFGKYTKQQFQNNLQAYEAIAGNQKKAAESLGINVATYRRWKTGKVEPKKEQIEKFNRKFGKNKTKLDNPEIMERIKKQTEKREKKRQVREPQRKREKVLFPKLLTKNYYLKKYFAGSKFAADLANIFADYVWFYEDNPTVAQYVNSKNRANIGKPMGTPAAIMYASYSEKESTNGRNAWQDLSLQETMQAQRDEQKEDEAKQKFIPSRIPFVEETYLNWDLQKTFDHIFEKTANIPHVERIAGKPVRFALIQFFGYHIKGT